MRRSYLILFVILFLLESVGLSQNQSVDLNQVPLIDTPSSYALTKWKDKKGYASMPLDLNTVRKVNLNCESKTLYPTHPEQTTKQYHSYVIASYDTYKLNPNDEACTLKSKYKNGAGKHYCQRSSTVESAVISDLYRDECSNIYRAFWRVTFLTTHDNMGTLFSKGRTMYPKPHSEFFGDMVIGDTYAVNESDFLFLSEVFASDVKAQ